MLKNFKKTTLPKPGFQKSIFEGVSIIKDFLGVIWMDYIVNLSNTIL